MPDVACTVTNCKYWGPNNECQANQIMVQTDHASGYSSDGPMTYISGTPADTKEETSCKTFEQQ